MNKIVLIIMLFISNHLISQITIKEFVQKTEYKDWETEPSYSNTEEDWYFKKDNKRESSYYGVISNYNNNSLYYYSYIF